MTTSQSCWSGRLAVGPWWLLYSGPIRPSEPHSHHAVQVVVHGGGRCVAVGQEPREGPIVVIRPDEIHTTLGQRDHALRLFIAPESYVGRQLVQGGWSSPKSLAQTHPVAQILGSLRTANWSQAEEAVRRIMDQLGVSDQRETMRWWRHPALDEALLRRPDCAAGAAIDIVELADEVGLSPVRLAEALPIELGLPIEPYVRWLRLVRATEVLAQGADITEASRAAHFSDGVEFSRTFRSMFGLSPEELLRLGAWVGGHERLT